MKAAAGTKPGADQRSAATFEIWVAKPSHTGDQRPSETRELISPSAHKFADVGILKAPRSGRVVANGGKK